MRPPVTTFAGAAGKRSVESPCAPPAKADATGHLSGAAIPAQEGSTGQAFMI
jgi:hypothetical protein